MEQTGHPDAPHNSQSRTADPWDPIFDRIERIMGLVGILAIRLAIGAMGASIGAGAAYVGWQLIGRTDPLAAFLGIFWAVIGAFPSGLVLVVLCQELDEYPEPKAFAHALSAGALVGIGAMALMWAYA